MILTPTRSFLVLSRTVTSSVLVLAKMSLIPQEITHIGGNLPQIACLEDLIRELNLIFAGDSVNIELVGYMMKSYKSNPIEWKKYAKFDRFR